jgi:hypothetical protein
MFSPAVTVKEVNSVSRQPVTGLNTITVKLYVAATPGGNVAVTIDESAFEEVINEKCVDLLHL